MSNEVNNSKFNAAIDKIKAADKNGKDKVDDKYKHKPSDKTENKYKPGEEMNEKQKHNGSNSNVNNKDRENMENAKNDFDKSKSREVKPGEEMNEKTNATQPDGEATGVKETQNDKKNQKPRGEKVMIDGRPCLKYPNGDVVDIATGQKIKSGNQ